MMGLKALRYKVASISSAIYSKRPRSTAKVTGSMAAGVCETEAIGFILAFFF